MEFDREVQLASLLREWKRVKLDPGLFHDGWEKRAVEDFNYKLARIWESLAAYLHDDGLRISQLEEKLSFLKDICG